MISGKQYTTLVSGLHSKELHREISGWMLMLDKEMTLNMVLEKELLLMTTRSGDVTVCQNDSFGANENVYLIQEMGRDPWQDLAVISTAARQLKRQGVKKVTSVVPVWTLGHHMAGIPYLSDRIGTQQLVADILKNSALDRLATLTPTSDMLTQMYPIEVVQIDFSEKLAQMVRTSEYYSPVILAVEEEVLPQVRALAHRGHWNSGVCLIHKDGIFVTEEITGRDVLLYTHHFSDRFWKAAENLLRQHCESVSCYAPWINNPEHVTGERRADSLRLLTLESGYEGAAERLPVEELIAGWILQETKIR